MLVLSATKLTPEECYTFRIPSYRKADINNRNKDALKGFSSVRLVLLHIAGHRLLWSFKGKKQMFFFPSPCYQSHIYRRQLIGLI